MKKIFIHNTYFRLFAPVFFGFVVYILILLIFDSIKQLSENFFSFEAILCILLAFIVSETMRFSIILLDKFVEKSLSIAKRITIQLIVNILLTILLVSLVVSGYMTYLVQMTTFKTEILVFNIIYTISAICYNVVWFAIYYLNRINAILYKSAVEQKEIIKSELETYKRRINPDFLFTNLENIISLAYIDAEKADNYILRLSEFYRTILHNKRNELIPISKELKAATDFVWFLNFKYHNCIEFSIESSQSSNRRIIPGTLSVIIEKIVNASIISGIQKLKIKCKIEDENLLIETNAMEKINLPAKAKDETQNIIRALTFYTDETIETKANSNSKTVKIPLLKALKQNCFFFCRKCENCF